PRHPRRHECRSSLAGPALGRADPPDGVGARADPARRPASGVLTRGRLAPRRRITGQTGRSAMANTETAILAGGCFWGMQDLIRKLPGVTATRVRYSGGDVPNATYRNHGTHAEAIEVVFDPTRLSYRDLLEFFFQIHDPTTPNRQGNDMGT